MSTSVGSPFQPMGVWSDSVDGLLRDQMVSIDFSDFSRLTSSDGGEVGMYTKRCIKGGNTVDISRKKVPGSYSLFDGIFTWGFDWSPSKRDNVSKESDSSSSGSDDPGSNASKESGSWTSGSTHQMSSMTDQDTELVGAKVECRFMNANNSDMKVTSRSLQDFDQQDWEFKLRENGYENEQSVYFVRLQGRI